MTKHRLELATSTPPALTVEIIEARCAALAEYGQRLLAELIELGKRPEQDRPAPVVPPESIDVNLMARALAAGERPSAAPAKPAPQVRNSSLIRQERDAVDAALKMLSQQRQALFVARAHSEMERRGAEWRALLHERGVLALKLQRANREQHKLAKEIRGKASGFALPAEWAGSRNEREAQEQTLLGFGYVNSDSTQEFLRALIAIGVLTESEICRTRGDEKERF